MLSNVARNTLLGRNVMKTIVRNGSHGGIPGENLPFSITSRTRFTINFFLFTGTGLAAPFVIMLHQLHKKNVMINAVRNHSHGGVPGENLPFDIHSRYKLTALFIVFLGSGLSAPFLITRHQLLKK